MKHNQSITLRAQNIQELRQILAEMNDSNQSGHQPSFNKGNIQQLYCQTQAKQLLEWHSEQLKKKKQLLEDVISFSFQLLNDIQRKVYKLEEAQNKQMQLQQKITQIYKQNQEILAKLHKIQEETENYKDKLEEAETYISELSQQKSQFSLIKISQKDVNDIFYQVQYYNESRSQRLMGKPDQNVQSKFISLIKSKDDQILYLEAQISRMQDQFVKLQKQLQQKKIQNKFTQVSLKQQINRLRQNISLSIQKIDCLPQESRIFQSQFSKANTFENSYQTNQENSNLYLEQPFQSLEQNNINSYYEQTQDQNNLSQYQDQNMLTSTIKNQYQKRSLRQQFFNFYPQKFQNKQNQNQQANSNLRIQSTSVGTQCIKKISKGVQADSNNKLTRTNIKACLTEQKAQKEQVQKEQNRTQYKNQNSFLMNIFAFAMKKAVSSRIKSKKNNKN